MKVGIKILTHSIVIGPLILISVLPAAAGQTTLGLSSGGVPLQLAGNDSTADRDTYTQQARNDMQDWEQKLHDYSEKADTKGQKAGDATKDDLDHAWTRAEAASNRLQNASAQNWQSAKISYEKASHDLEASWNKMRIQDK
jgi:hypothetical protein